MQITHRDQFLKLLAKSNLLSNEALRRATEEHELATLDDSLEISRRLVKSGLLTRYQAEQLLSGRARGMMIDHYRVLELIGFGGMGRLYLAEDTETKTLVAIKVLNEKYRHETGMLLRMKLEAAAGERLQHDHIVRTLEFRDTGATCYLAMEFVSGINLLELLALKGTLPWEQVCDYMRQAAIALQYAHDAGIIHRDVKLENLMVTKQGQVRLLDFGLALLPDHEDSEFSLSMIFGHDCIGTPDYLPPEQAADAQTVTAQADQYSLGCSMYFLLTAQLPFMKQTARERIEAHQNETPPSIKSLVPDVPQKVVAIVDRMMQKNPAARFGSMRELIEALVPLSAQEPLEFSVNGAIHQRVKLARKKSSIESSSRTRPRLSSKAASVSEITELASKRAEGLDTKLGTDTLTSYQIQEKLPLPDASIVAGEVAENLLPKHAASAVLVNRETGNRYKLTRDKFVIGREESCDLTIAASDVSSKHCQLRREGQWWTITDLDSTNGVQVNGQKVSQQMLWHGDEIVISFVNCFQILDPNQPDPTQKSSLSHRLKVLMGTLLPRR